MYKIAACCQLGELRTNRNGVTKFEQFSDTKMGTITVKSMQTLTESSQYTKLVGKVKQNLNALQAQINYVAKLPANQRMFRISSDMFPLYTFVDLNHLYDEKLRNIIKAKLSHIGKVAKQHGIRLSTHPSQFTTLSSDKDNVIDNAIRDLEMHVWLFECMGLEPEDGVCINIHCNGASFELPQRAAHLFKWISLENDEKKAGFDKTLTLCETYGIRMVLDLHHFYCEQGDYLPIDDPRLQRVLATWGNQRPLFHLSQSRGDANFRELCAHSDMIDDPALIEYAVQFCKYADFDIEAKHKNLASASFALEVEKEFG